jgi:hypothetical protein
MRSMKEFGFTAPILIDADNQIIAGHARAEAAKRLGLSPVPCLRLGHLTEAQKRAYLIADNRLAEKGAGWDETLLAQELQALQAADFDATLTGWSSREIVRLTSGSLTLEDIQEDKPELARFMEQKEAAKKRMDEAQETNFWVCLIFQTYDQKQAFLAQVPGPDVLYGMYVNGPAFAAAVGRPVEISSTRPPKPSLTKALTDLVHPEEQARVPADPVVPRKRAKRGDE